MAKSLALHAAHGALSGVPAHFARNATRAAAHALDPLAVSSAERVPGDDTPTIRESGLDVVLANWRGVLAPPGTDAETRDWLTRALAAMRASPIWQTILRDNEWEDSFLTGPELERFLDDERVRADTVLRSIGLVGAP